MEVVVMEEALLFGENEAKAMAAKELIHLTHKQRQKLAEKGVITPLVSMLHSQDYEATQASLFALLSLAYGSERNKIRIAKSGAVPRLLELTQCRIESLVEHAIAAIMILSSCAPNKLLIAAAGAIPVLNETLKDNFNTTQARLDIIVTLHNLSTCHQVFPFVVSSNTATSLIQLIDTSEKSSELVEKAMPLLENIVSSSEVALRETAITGGSIGNLVETMEEGSPQCKESAVRILLLICRSSRDAYRGIILREGVMPGLLQLSIDGTQRAKRAAKSLLLLLRDCPSVCSRTKGVKNVLFEQVMGQIDRGDETETELRMVEEMIAKLRT